MPKNIPTNPKKLKRYLENEYYAQSASFWMGAVKTADRLGHKMLRPINGMAARGITNQKLKRKKSRKGKRWKEIEETRKTTVYAVKFEDPKGEWPTFIKVGITGTTIEARFAADFDRYNFVIIKDREVKNLKTALLLESALHNYLKPHSFRPEKALASGGNSECFTYTEELERIVKNLLT